ncbi:MAG: class I SAM-dependent methyltransferase [Slackia sp.]|nr:class I SAM-dependent methyltransferase [Slackia sp.]
MDMKTAEILCNVTSDFYRAQAASFSATRTAPWHGWRRCVAMMAEALGVADGSLCVGAGRLRGEGVVSRGPLLCDGMFDADSAEREVRHVEITADGNAGEAAPCETEGAMRPAVSVFDLACGNLRFERYLEEALPCADVRAYAVDGCDELAASASELGILVTYESSDIVGGLIAGASLCELHHAPQTDMAVSFGFLHHVPDERLRVRVLEGLIDAVRPGGCVAVSLWQFMNNPALAAKAQATHAQAGSALGLAADAFDEGDYLLGWKNVERAWRYCHHFSDEEVGRLIDAVSSRARLIDAFEADGRTGAMNKYLVLQRA